MPQHRIGANILRVSCRADRGPSLRSGFQKENLPSPRLQQIAFGHGGNGQPFHGTDQVLADFK